MCCHLHCNQEWVSPLQCRHYLRFPPLVPGERGLASGERDPEGEEHADRHAAPDFVRNRTIRLGKRGQL